MPIGIGAAMLIGGAASAGASIYGASKASSSNDKAIAAQTAANDKALAFEQQKLSDLNTRMAPYRQAGAAATGRMSDLLHLGPGGNAGPQTGPLYPPQGAGQPVTLRAPNGSTKVLTDPALIAHYQQQGAQVVS